MAQHDYVIDNQTAPNFRADLNNALLAIASNNSGPTAPSTTYANMMWYDSNSNILKMRNEADDAWIDIGTLNQSTDQFEVANLTTLLQSDWEAGTSTTEAIVSPAKVKAAIDALGYSGFDSGQVWQSVSRSGGVTYRNTTGRAIQVSLNYLGTATVYFQVSQNGSSWLSIATFDDDAENFTGIIPNGTYYRVSSGSFVWRELR